MEKDNNNMNVKERLEATVAHCVSCYKEWTETPKNIEVRQHLEEAVHELRKVTSRIEIELAIADRSNSSLKPMPIPPHRAARPRSGAKIERPQKNNDENAANRAPKKETATISLDGNDDGAKKGRRPKLKTVQPKATPED